MRVLIVMVLALGCYSPSVQPCQFRCGADGGCPDGTSCIQGFCRSSSAACAGGDNVDASRPIDASSLCPLPPANCGPAFEFPDKSCGTMCATVPATWFNARTACSAAGWTLAILENQDRLDAVPVQSARWWVGADRAFQGAPWKWVDDTDVDTGLWAENNPADQGGHCATVQYDAQQVSNRLSNTAVTCSDLLGFVCVTDRL